MKNLNQKENFQNDIFGNLKKMALSRQMILMWLILIGIVFISGSILIPEEHHLIKSLLEKCGEAVIIIGVIDFLRHVYHENEVQTSRQEEIKAIVLSLMQTYLYDKVAIEAMIRRVAEEVVLNRDKVYSLINRSGIEEIKRTLDITQILNDLSNLSNCKIRINVIFLPDCERICRVLFECMAYRNCKLELILCDPNLRKALDAREKAVDSGLVTGYYSRTINDNIRELQHLYNRLPPHVKGNMTVKKHKSFIGASMYGYADTFWTGFYLSNRMATDGTNIKVTGYKNFFFHELRAHFKSEWSKATTIIGGELVYDLN